MSLFIGIDSGTQGVKAVALDLDSGRVVAEARAPHRLIGGGVGLIAGYGGKTVNVLRLYAARASTDFEMKVFNSGDYIKAVEQKVLSETLSKVLYPSDQVRQGQLLRLLQEYFMVACALRDILREGRKILPERALEITSGVLSALDYSHRAGIIHRD